MRSQAASARARFPRERNLRVLEGLHDWHAALEAECDAANAALQCAGALDRLMDPWIGSMRTITVSQLMGTTAGDILVRRISEDPSECIDAFNLAVDRHPTVGIRRLDDGPEGRPLPLWVRMGTDCEPRPSPICRPAGCIPWRAGSHGHGAARPCGPLHSRSGRLQALRRGDGVVADGWLGLRPGRRAMATADLTLPLLGDPGFASARNELLQQARRRRHDPETSGAARGPGPRRRSWRRSARCPAVPGNAGCAWDRMHEWLDRQGGSEVDRDKALRCIEALASSVGRDGTGRSLSTRALRELQLAIEAELG